jgi:hypothetical protein
MSGNTPQDLKTQDLLDVRIIEDVARLRLKDQSGEVAHNDDNRSESHANRDEGCKQAPSTPQPTDSLPDFEANMMGPLNVKEAESAETLWEGFKFSFRGPGAEDNEWTFVNLMNKAYPHAIFHPHIFDAYWHIENNVHTHVFLEESPEFIAWWRIAHVPPTTELPSVPKPLRQQAKSKPLDPGFLGLCYWLVDQAKVPPRTSSEGQHHVKSLKQQAKPKPLYPDSIGFRNQSVNQNTVLPEASSEGYHHVERSDSSDVPADDDVHMEDVTSKNAYLELDWDEIDAVEASFGD